MGETILNVGERLRIRERDGQFSFSESNGAIERFEQDNGSADGDSDTEECPNQKIFREADGLEFRIARNRFRSKNEADGRSRL